MKKKVKYVKIFSGEVLMTIVFKLSDNLKNMVIKYYEKYMPLKTPPYAVFQVKNYDTTITLYESGKIMFQGLSADIEASLWIEQERIKNKRYIDITGKEKKNSLDKKDKKTLNKYHNMATIGSDEVGTGDYFGPIVVSATYVSKENIDFLLELGVRDSKKITDDKILEIAPAIAKRIPYVTYVLDNDTYNKLPAKDKNMNKIKAILHNKVLVSLIKKDKFDYEAIVIDQFVYPQKFYEHISGAKEKISNVTFMTKAEDQVLSVACASIISRYIFLKEMKKISLEIGEPVVFGASDKVDLLAKRIINTKGEDFLKHYVKWNFKNTEKIKNN